MADPQRTSDRSPAMAWTSIVAPAPLPRPCHRSSRARIRCPPRLTLRRPPRQRRAQHGHLKTASRQSMLQPPAPMVGRLASLICSPTGCSRTPRMGSRSPMLARRSTRRAAAMAEGVGGSMGLSYFAGRGSVDVAAASRSACEPLQSRTAASHSLQLAATPLKGCGARSTIRCRCGRCLGRDAEIGEQGLHVAAEGFVVAVDGGPVLGWHASSWCADPGGEGPQVPNPARKRSSRRVRPSSSRLRACRCFDTQPPSSKPSRSRYPFGT